MKKSIYTLIVSAALLSTQALADTTVSDPTVKTYSKITASSGIQFYPALGIPLTTLKGDLFLDSQLALSAQLDTWFGLVNWVSLGATYFIEPTGNGFFAQANLGYANTIDLVSAPYGELGAGYRFPTNEKGDFVDFSGNFQAYATGSSTFGLRLLYGKTF